MIFAKKFFFSVLVFVFFLPLTLNAEEKIIASKYFDKQKSYTENLYVLNDVLVFSMFDISEVKIFDHSGNAKVQLSAVDGSSQTSPQIAKLDGKKEVEAVLKDIPKFYYKSLKQKILEYDVPMTLYAKNPPSYAKPIRLSIKLKEIYLLPVQVNKDGNYIQPISMKIYGQLKDKKNNKVLTRFYDSASSDFLLGVGPQALKESLNQLANNMMKDLALYLRTKY